MEVLMSNIALILPAYNEELTIGQTIEQFSNELPDALIVVIDNNSSDLTSMIARDTFSRLGLNGIVLLENDRVKATRFEEPLLKLMLISMFSRMRT